MPMENTEETTEKKNRHGLIAEDKVRISLVIPRDLKEKLDSQAQSENRSMSNYIVTILMTAVSQAQEK